jgi:5-methylcytosine-specific restriction protein A
MSRRVCRIPGCPTITNDSLCPTHKREARQQRGTTTQQGLGWQHQKRRAQLIAKAIGTRCPDCGTLMTNPRKMVADHRTARSIDPASKADRVHCRPCSDRQGGTLAHQQWPRPPHPGG